jgi:hypothetical protein
MNPKPGDFGLVRISGAVGLGIRVAEALNGDGWEHDIQHAFFVLPDGQLLEAEPGGARIRPLSEYDGIPVTWSGWDLSDVQRDLMVAASARYEGVPYSFLDYGSLAARRLHIPVPGLRSYIASTGHMICSQLIVQIYTDGGAHLFQDNRWPGDVTPMELWNVLKGPQR